MKRTAIALALVVAACGGAQDSANTTTPGGGLGIAMDESWPDEEKLVTLVEALAAQVSSAGSDCAAVGSALQGWVDTHSTNVAELSRSVEAQNSGVPNAKIDELDARLDRAWDSVFSNSKACEAEAKPALDRLDAMFGI